MDLMLFSSEATKLLKELQYLKQRILISHGCSFTKKRICNCLRSILAIGYVYHCNARTVLLVKDKCVDSVQVGM